MKKYVLLAAIALTFAAPSAGRAQDQGSTSGQQQNGAADNTTTNGQTSGGAATQGQPAGR